jgi:hypothetical protein
MGQTTHVRNRHVRDSGMGAAGAVSRATHGIPGFTSIVGQSPVGQLYGSVLDTEPLTMPDLTGGIIDGATHVLPGSIDTPLFVQSIRPPHVVSALPSLPDPIYPPGDYAFLTTTSVLYLNTADVWVIEDGSTITNGTLVAGLVRAGAIATEQLAADAVIANVVNVGGTVTINEDGILIADQFGTTGLTSAGFQGSWLGFLISGLYNNQFQYGVDGAMAMGDLPPLSGVPYWFYSFQSNANVTASRVAAATAPGGSVIELKQTVSAGGSDSYGYIAQGDADGFVYHRVQAGRSVVCRAAWRASGASLSEPQVIRFTLLWIDKDGVQVGADQVDTAERTATDPADTYTWDHTFPVQAPQDAVYLALRVGVHWTLGNSTNDLAQIAELDVQVADFEFRQLNLGEFTLIDEFGGSFPNQLVIDNGSGSAIVRVEGQLRTTGALDVEGTIIAGEGGGDDVEISAQGYMEQRERTDPAAPAANRSRLFTRDNGAGKTQLCVRFSGGAVQVLATQP